MLYTQRGFCFKEDLLWQLNLESIFLTLTSKASDISLLALLRSPSDCLSERTSIGGLLEFSSMNVLQSM